jgi:hypothetical protein
MERHKKLKISYTCGHQEALIIGSVVFDVKVQATSNTEASRTDHRSPRARFDRGVRMAAKSESPFVPASIQCLVALYVLRQCGCGLSIGRNGFTICIIGNISARANAVQRALNNSPVPQLASCLYHHIKSLCTMVASFLSKRSSSSV